MSNLKTLIADRKDEFKGNVKDLNKLIKKIESTWHAPTSEKHTKRMEPFAKIPELVDFVNDTLLSYFSNNKNFEKEESGFSSYDIKETWYLFTLLVYSDKVELAVESILSTMLESRNEDLFIIRRILNLCGNPVYEKQLKKVEAFFANQNKTTEVYKWMNALDVTPPQTFNWEMVFRLEAKPVKPENIKITDNLFITIKAFEPLGDGKSFEINVSDRDNNISSDWNDFSEESFIRLKKEKLPLPFVPGLKNLNLLITELEKLFELKFERKYHFQYFTKGFKNKNNIQKWLQKC